MFFSLRHLMEASNAYLFEESIKLRFNLIRPEEKKVGHIPRNQSNFPHFHIFSADGEKFSEKNNLPIFLDGVSITHDDRQKV
jgi:hypothetical protein